MNKKNIKTNLFVFGNIEVGIAFYLDHKTFYIDCLGYGARFTKESFNYSNFPTLDSELMLFSDIPHDMFLLENNNIKSFIDFCRYMFIEYKNFDFDFNKMQEKYCNPQLVIRNG